MTHQAENGRGHGFRKGLVGLGLGLWISGLGLVGGPPASEAQEAAPGVTARVVLDQQAYRLGVEPIKLAVTVENVRGEEILARTGFTTQRLALLLTFTDPAGQPLIADEKTQPSDDPPFPEILFVAGAFVEVDELERLAADFVQSVTVPDARTLYTALGPPGVAPGFYRVTCQVPLRTYLAVYRTEAGVEYAQQDAAAFEGYLSCPRVSFAVFTDADGDGVTFPVPDPAVAGQTQPDCDDGDASVFPGATEIVGDGKDNDCDPTTSDVPTVAPAVLEVAVENKAKQPLAGVPVHVYSKAPDSCAAGFGFNPAPRATIWFSCGQHVVASGVTDSAGELTLPVPPGDYLVLAQVDPTPSSPASGDEEYDGKSAEGLLTGVTQKVKFKFK